MSCFVLNTMYSRAHNRMARYLKENKCRKLENVNDRSWLELESGWSQARDDVESRNALPVWRYKARDNGAKTNNAATAATTRCTSPTLCHQTRSLERSEYTCDPVWRITIIVDLGHQHIFINHGEESRGVDEQLEER